MRPRSTPPHDQSVRRNMVEQLTAFRPGHLGDHPNDARDEMFIDCSPYLSLRGIGLGQSRDARDRETAKDPRAPTDPGDAARARSRGQTSSHRAAGEGFSNTLPHHTRAFGNARKRKRGRSHA